MLTFLLLLELSDITSRDYHSRVAVEKAILSYLHLASLFLDKYLSYDEQLSRCVKKLVHSPIFRNNKTYVRRKFVSFMVSQLAQESMSKKIIIGAFLLIDGRSHSWTLEMLQDEKALPCIISTVWKNHDQEGPTSVILSRIFLDLLYEMCKVQKLGTDDLQQISVEFIEYLFGAIENRDDYDHDPYGYAILKVLLALNEQYMIKSCEIYQAKYELSESKQNNIIQQHSVSVPVNKVFETLAKHKEHYPTFGENIVFLLNRSNDTCIRLMVLKILYLVFSTTETCDYIYLNDLKVIVDVFIRELQDLPVEEERLRHTYLRVFLPLLLNTELRRDAYKRNEIVSLLSSMGGKNSVFEISETTQRLSFRCLSVDWLGYFPVIPHHRRSISENNYSINCVANHHSRSVSGTSYTTNTTLNKNKDTNNLSFVPEEKHSISQPISPLSSISSFTSTLPTFTNNTGNTGNISDEDNSDNLSKVCEPENTNENNNSSRFLLPLPPPPPPSRLVHARHKIKRNKKPPPPIPTDPNHFCGLPPPLPSPRKQHSYHKHNNSDIELANVSLPTIKEKTIHSCTEVTDIDDSTMNSNHTSDSEELFVTTTYNLPPLPRKQHIVPVPPPPHSRRMTIQ